MPSSWTIECSCFDDVSLQFLFLQEGILRSKAPLMLFLRLCCQKPCRLKREKNQSVEWRKSKWTTSCPSHIATTTPHILLLLDGVFICRISFFLVRAISMTENAISMWRNLYVWVSTLYAYFLFLWFYWASRYDELLLVLLELHMQAFMK
jgi:hypothetical protein